MLCNIDVSVDKDSTKANFIKNIKRNEHTNKNA